MDVRGPGVAEHVCSRNSAADTASLDAVSASFHARAMNFTTSSSVPALASVSLFVSFRHAALSTLSGPNSFAAPPRRSPAASPSTRRNSSSREPSPDRMKTLHCSLVSSKVSSLP